MTKITGLVWSLSTFGWHFDAGDFISSLYRLIQPTRMTGFKQRSIGCIWTIRKNRHHWVLFFCTDYIMNIQCNGPWQARLDKQETRTSPRVSVRSRCFSGGGGGSTNDISCYCIGVFVIGHQFVRILHVYIFFFITINWPQHGGMRNFVFLYSLCNNVTITNNVYLMIKCVRNKCFYEMFCQPSLFDLLYHISRTLYHTTTTSSPKRAHMTWVAHFH